jgi:hypothetical protein
MNKSSIIESSLASFRAKVSELESKLSISTLYGSGYMILADCPSTPENVMTVVLGTFDRPGHYAVNSPRVFCSLDITPDHLCGVCLYPREDALANIAILQADPTLASLSGWAIRHIREEQTRRLANWRDMVKTLEGIQAGQGEDAGNIMEDEDYSSDPFPHTSDRETE